MTSSHPDLGLRETSRSACGCGCTDGADVPRLDAREIPHAIRHASILGTVAGLRDGDQFDLVAPHDPLPLLAQIADREGESVTFDYVERGPDAWVLRFTRRA